MDWFCVLCEDPIPHDFILCTECSQIETYVAAERAKQYARA